MNSDARPLPAHHLTPGVGATVLFLPGFASDMRGTKALHLEAWARERGRAFCRFDYGGCGETPGVFEDQRFADWLDDALAIIERVIAGPVILVGSSMGGWIMLHAALRRPERVVGLVGVAAAPDFTDWGFTTEQKLALLQHGRLERPNPYGPEPSVTSRAFWQSGEAHRLMSGAIAIDVPLRLIHSLDDPDVPWTLAGQLTERVRSADVQAWLVKGGGHRLSRAEDLALLVRAVEDVSATIR